LCCCTQALGRTPLNEVSPKKTLEGAAVGLSASVAVAVLLARLLQWPTSIPRYYLSWMQ
jgi:phosphatidate cytidylyltransferase